MDAGFPLSAFYSKVDNAKDREDLKAYLQQARQELSSRLAELVIDPATNRPSKWWMCFIKRKFLGKSLDPATSK
jgi:actin related protein 2/3 complex subunit 3